MSERFDRYGVPTLDSAMDMLADGGSPEPPYTLDDMGADVVALMDHLGIGSAHVAGASMGGMTAQIVTARHPDRVRTLISIMSTSGAAHLPVTSFDNVPPRPPLDAPRDVQVAFGVAMMRADAGNNQRIFDPGYARLRAQRDYNRTHGWSGEGRQLLATMNSGDRVELLRTVHQPVLVLHGDRDPYFSLDHARHVAGLLDHPTLAVIEGMGHSVEPALVPAIVRPIFRHIDDWQAAAAVAGGR